MFRRSLPENGGMLFLYDPAAGAMWMKNTLIPLDMVFISDDGKVHRIETNAEPFSRPDPLRGAVVGMLEVNGGRGREDRAKVRRQGRLSRLLKRR